MYKTPKEMLEAVDEGRLKPHVAIATVCMQLSHEQRRALLLLAGLLAQDYVPVRSGGDVVVLVPPQLQVQEGYDEHGE